MMAAKFTKRLMAMAMLAGFPAAAQDANADRDQLEATQEELFAQMLNAPDDLDLMFQHALVSIRLEDFESAISTLDRMLIFNPDLSRAKVELGAAYFRLGAYENARFYFEDVLENDNPPPEVARRINGFLDEIGRRTQSEGGTLVASFGVTYSTNANLGPSDSEVFLANQLVALDQGDVESSDIGFRTSVTGRHFIDLNEPDGDNWITEASLFALHYIDETQGDIDSFTFRTGPRISLDEQSFGPKLRPYLYGDFVVSGNELLYATAGIGADYSDSISDQLNIFLSAQSSWREYDVRSDFDGSTHRLTGSFAYTPDPEVTYIGLAYVETDRTQADFNANIEVGARLGATYRYDPSFEFTDRLWTVSGFVGGAYRLFDDNDPTISTTTREDLDLRAGVSHVFHLTGGWFMQADADFLYRDSNIRNFDLDNLGVGFSVGRTF
ncbi:MAG: surface lipoprotein assembly modifier [Pseudomonadota bacterium]